MRYGKLGDSVNSRIRVDLYDEAARYAVRTGRSVTSVINDLLDRALNHRLGGSAMGTEETSSNTEKVLIEDAVEGEEIELDMGCRIKFLTGMGPGIGSVTNAEGEALFHWFSSLEPTVRIPKLPQQYSGGVAWKLGLVHCLLLGKSDELGEIPLSSIQWTVDGERLGLAKGSLAEGKSSYEDVVWEIDKRGEFDPSRQARHTLPIVTREKGLARFLRESSPIFPDERIMDPEKIQVKLSGLEPDVYVVALMLVSEVPIGVSFHDITR